jgi:hypothetical protein
LETILESPKHINQPTPQMALPSVGTSVECRRIPTRRWAPLGSAEISTDGLTVGSNSPPGSAGYHGRCHCWMRREGSWGKRGVFHRILEPEGQRFTDQFPSMALLCQEMNRSLVRELSIEGAHVEAFRTNLSELNLRPTCTDLIRESLLTILGIERGHKMMTI